jgi:hypothetical protein
MAYVFGEVKVVDHSGNRMTISEGEDLENAFKIFTEKPMKSCVQKKDVERAETMLVVATVTDLQPAGTLI